MEGAGLTKKERLSGEKNITRLFAEGKSGFTYPFRYYWRRCEPAEGKAAVSVLFSVPKKLFKRAVKRNLLKRRSREAYRLNKTQITGKLTQHSLPVEVALIYTAKEAESFKTIENGVKRILAEIGKSL